MNANREQILFLVVLAITGVATYFNISGGYESSPLSRGKSFEPVPAPDMPVVQLSTSNEKADYSPDGRDIFAPPRDWNPLAPLVLDAPPLPEVGAVGLIPAPGVEAGHDTLFRRQPPPTAAELSVRARADSADEFAAGGAGEGGGSEGGTSGADGRFGGIDFSTGEAREEVADEGTLERSYDWVKRKNQRRVFGIIQNTDRFALLDDPSLAVRFKLVNVKTGKVQAEAPFERDALDGNGQFNVGFGFADTVSTRVVLLRREVRPSVGNIKSQIEAARTCLGWADEEEAAALQGAEEFLRTVLGFDPGEAGAWELLGRVRKRAFDTEGELEVYDQAREAGVDTARLQTRRALVFQRLGLYELAVRTLTEALGRAPNEFETLMALGKLYGKLDRGGEAVPLFERAAKAAPDANLRHSARVAMVRCLIRTGQLESAATEIDRVLRMGIDDAEALVLKGVIDLTTGENAAARTSFHEALALDPRHRNAVFDLGVALALEAVDDPQLLGQARSRFDEAANLAPLTVFDSTLAKGALEESLGNVEQAAALFEEALLYDPGSPFGLYRAGRIARRSGNLDLAEEQLRRVLEEDGRIADVLLELGYTSLLLDEPEDAAHYLRELLRTEPGNQSARILLGSALLRQERVTEALDQFKLGVGDADNPHPAALCGLAWCAYREGLVEEALKSLADARAVSKLEGDAFHLYANRNQAAIDDHRAKEQWLDRFDRKQIKNNWEIVQSFGPEIQLIDGGGVRFEGMQRPTEVDERTELKREIVGATFVSLEARVKAASRSEAIVGIRFAYEKSRGRGQGTQAYGEVAVVRFPDGSIRVQARSDYEELIFDWVVIENKVIPADEPVRLAIERVDYDKGMFRVLVDDRTVMPDFEVRSLKKLNKMVAGAVFASAGARKNIDFSCDLVRVVRYRDEK
ncbi:MAG: tetratricopeptide repeat protein [Planctomycetota bacterium]